MHPNGNIAEFLTSAGLAKVIDVSSPMSVLSQVDLQWHAGILAPLGGLDKLRAAEKAAKDKRIGVWENFGPVKPTNGTANTTTGPPAAPTTKGNTLEATITRIWGSDQLSMVAKGQENERRIQLASVRGPRGNEGKQQYYANEAKEWVLKARIPLMIDFCESVWSARLFMYSLIISNQERETTRRGSVSPSHMVVRTRE